ncbi:putative cytochrome c subunit VB [Tricharina praecox]|uniref:putative cytochrome c subunit VB n=1 Tax=Tricharina praecox TaxID=43433 RepID=UPI00221EBCD6|nr:putative cytochrome c subunit VB [Tricharina praecox]KAI5844890.1 putative cytochrome c subunit VB [Tricharina praecox]
MFATRALTSTLRRAALPRAVAAATSRPLSVSAFRAQSTPEKKYKTFNEIKTESDLLPPGAPPGTVPTDLDQATGLERLEILGKMEGVDIFDMSPLDASRRGTLEDPITVSSYGDERYLGCTGYPADSHVVIWLTVSKDRPIERCPECGSVYKMDYVGPEESHDHHHGDHAHEPLDPPTMADFVKSKYW